MVRRTPPGAAPSNPMIPSPEPEAASAIDQFPPWVNRILGITILVVLASYVSWVWSAPRNYVELVPQQMPAHIFVIRPFVRSENQFEYFL